MIVFEAIGKFILDYALWVAIVLFLINLIVMCTYAADKKKAIKGKWRIPEATLIGMAWAFGGVGAMLGMYVFRHKTKHIKFTVLVPMAFVVQIALILVSVIAAMLA